MFFTTSIQQSSDELKVLSVTPNLNDGRVAVNSNIVITFNQPIMAGSGKVILRDNEYRIVLEESIDSPRITIVGATLSFDPLDDLASYFNYHIQITDNAVKTMSGVGFASWWQFDFQTNFVQIPVQVTGTPTDNRLHGGTANDTLNGGDGRDLLFGFAGDDVLTGGDDTDGWPGSDQLFGGDGADTLHGNAGNDELNGENGNDQLFGDAGDDTLTGGSGSDLLEGGTGNDSLIDSEGNDTLRGGEGNDNLISRVNASGSTYLLEGGAGDDYLYAETAGIMNGGEGNDRISLDLSFVQTKVAELVGGDGDDQFSIRYFAYPASPVSIVGGNGVDTFKLSRVYQDSINWKPAHAQLTINDFVAGAGGDQLDVSSLIQNNSGIRNPFEANGYLRLKQDGSDVLLQELPYGSTTRDYFDIVRLKNVQLSQLNAANFVGGINPDGSLKGLVLKGTEKADDLNGDLMNDEIYGYSGPDFIRGNAGDDILVGGDETSYDDADRLSGGAGNDLMKGGAGDDSMGGDDGDDTLEGGSGNDYMDGDAGNDRLDGGAGNDHLEGGDGNNVLLGGLGNDSIENSSRQGSFLDGGEGDDSISSRTGPDTIHGGDGNDRIYISTFSALTNYQVVANGGNGDDVLVIDGLYIESFGPKLDLIFDGGNGKDLVTISKISFNSLTISNFSAAEGDSVDLKGIFSTRFVGNPFGSPGFLRAEQRGQDVLISADLDGASGQQYAMKPLMTLSNVVLSSLNGSHFVGGWNPNGSNTGVRLTGTSGNDTLTGADLDDQLDGGDGSDKLSGGSGDDSLSGGNGNDTLSGEAGNDTLMGGNGNDTLSGQAGNDTLLGGDGDDRLDDDNGKNILSGEAGNDRFLSNGIGNTLLGGTGNDYFSTSTGIDSLDGGDGNDIFEITYPIYTVDLAQTTVVVGGAGDDKLIYSGLNSKSKVDVTGGSGIDTYQLSGRGVSGLLQINDFTPGVGGDVIDIGTMLGTDHRGGNPFAPGGILKLSQVGADVELAILPSNMDTYNPIILLKGINLSSLVKENFTRGINPRGTDDGFNLTGTANADQIDGDFQNDTIDGGAGDDTLDGVMGNDVLNGGEGNDRLVGNLGNDTMHGGAGNDSLGNSYTGATGDYRLYGDEGDDYLSTYSSGTHVLDGGDGNDTLNLNKANATLLGGAGDDILNIETWSGVGSMSHTFVDANGGEGNDIISFYGGSGNTEVLATGGSGTDTFMVRVSSSLSQFVVTDFKAGIGGDLLNLEVAIGGAGLNNPFGAVGILRLQQRNNDTVIQIDTDGVKGNNAFQDLVTLKDIQVSSLVAENFVGGFSPDGSNRGVTVDGKAGADTLTGRRFNDTLNGYGGDDTISGGFGDDQLNGGDGNDFLTDSGGSNSFSGGNGNDQISISKSIDSSADGGAGDDTINIVSSGGIFNGGEGNDVFFVTNNRYDNISSVAVSVQGGTGNDVIRLYDVSYDRQVQLQVTGGEGRDIYMPDRMYANNTYTVLDFDLAEYGDQISVSGIFYNTGYSVMESGNPFTQGYLKLVQDGNDTLLQFDFDGSNGTLYQANTVLTLKNIEAGKLTMNHFEQYINPNGGAIGVELLGDTQSNQIVGGWLKDKLFGLAGDDTLYGSAGDDVLDGGDGNDLFSGGSGNDAIKGGQGFDTVMYTDRFYAYSITKTEAGLTLNAKNKIEGTDVLFDVEYLRFSDMHINLAMRQQAASIDAKDLKSLVEIYVAFFNRTPDADGLSYWIDQFKSGQSISQISESFYNIGASPQFSNLTGFTATMTNTDFVNTFYKNVLGRSSGADAGGLAYWMNKLATGESTRGSLAQDILNSAHSFKGDATFGYVADLLDNKYQVGKTVAIDWGITYTENAYQRGVAIAKAVTAQDTNVALSLVGVAAADMYFI